MNWYQSWKRAAHAHREMADTFLKEAIFWGGAGNIQGKPLIFLAIDHQRKAIFCIEKMGRSKK